MRAPISISATGLHTSIVVFCGGHSQALVAVVAEFVAPPLSSPARRDKPTTHSFVWVRLIERKQARFVAFPVLAFLFVFRLTCWFARHASSTVARRRSGRFLLVSYRTKHMSCLYACAYMHTVRRGVGPPCEQRPANRVCMHASTYMDVYLIGRSCCRF